jgi:two-component system NtrC family sensor kinase
MALMSTLSARLAASVRLKLMLLVLAPLVVGLPVLITLVIFWANTAYDRLLIIKVNGDLVAAQKYFERVSELVGSDLQSLANSTRFDRRGSDTAALTELLERERVAARWDFLHLLDASGRVIAAAHGGTVGSDQSAWPVVAARR